MPARRAFTLIELLVVISIIALLVGILLPALGAARRTARSAICLTNQRQIMIAQYSYAADNKDVFAPAQDWKPISYDGEQTTAPYWFVILTAQDYAGGSRGATTGSSVYMCPEGVDEEVQDTSGNVIRNNLFEAAKAIPSNGDPRLHPNGLRYIAQGGDNLQLRTNYAVNTVSATFIVGKVPVQSAFPMQYSFQDDRSSATGISAASLPRTKVDEMIWPDETFTFFDGLAGTMLFASGAGVTNAFGRMINRHGDNINYAFVGGHAASVSTGEVPDPSDNRASANFAQWTTRPKGAGPSVMINSQDEFAIKVLAYDPVFK